MLCIFLLPELIYSSSGDLSIVAYRRKRLLNFQSSVVLGGVEEILGFSL